MRWPWQKAPEVKPDAAPTPGECGERGGSYTVHWSWPEKTANNKENAFLPLTFVHEDSPTLSLNSDYVGPLCIHELHYLNGGDRTFVIPMGQSFEVTKA